MFHFLVKSSKLCSFRHVQLPLRHHAATLRLVFLRCNHHLLASIITVGTGSVAGALQWNRQSQCQEQSRARLSYTTNSVLEFTGRTYRLQYSSHGGPTGLGYVLVSPKGSEVPTSKDFAAFLDHLEELASQHHTKIEGAFVLYFDTSHVVWPSMCSLPRIASVLRERQPPSILKNRTEGIVVIHNGSRFLGVIVNYFSNIVISILKPELVPVIASSREAADKLLATQLAQRKLLAFANA